MGSGVRRDFAREPMVAEVVWCALLWDAMILGGVSFTQLP